MADNYTISVGVKADFSELKAQSQQGAAALENFQTRSGAAVQAFQAAAKEGAKAAEFLNKQMAELGAAGVAVVPAMEQAVAAFREMQAAQEGAAASSGHLTNAFYATQGAARLLEGHMPTRAVERLIASSETASSILLSAFPVIGAVGLGIVLADVIKRMVSFGNEATELGRELGTGWLDGAIGQMTGLASATKQADDEAMRLAADQDRLRNQSQAADIEHIRLTQGEGPADYAKAGQLQDRINAIERMKAVQLAAIDEARRRAESAHTVDMEGSQGVLKARVEQAAATKQYNDLLAQEAVLVKQKENLYLEAQKAEEKGKKEPKPNYSDALAAQEEEQGKSLGSTVVYWEQVVAATGKYHAQLLRAEEAFRRELMAKGKIAMPAGAGAEPGAIDMAGLQAAETPSMKPQLGSMDLADLQGLQKSIAPMGPAGLGEKQLAEYQRIQTRITQILEQESRKREEVAKQEQEKQQRAFEKTFQGLTGPLNQFTDYWLTNSHWMGMAFTNMLDQMAMHFIDFEMVTLEKHIATELQKRLATEISNTAQVASTAAATATTGTLETMSSIKSLTKSAAKAAGKAWSAFADIPVVGPELGAIAAAATYTGVMALAAFEKGGIIPGSIGSAVPILGHAGEAVLPQPLTAMLTNAAQNGGTGAVHYHDHTSLSGIDGASVEGMYRNNAAAGRREFMRQLRRMNKI